ncbi:hypothetical protein KFE25_004852 [Diacronema lutheri]|uniref:U6 snRNA-associated Sm-like protein LSm1 n=1 Tax=Diacronema lutheri TaxID=2081491 RepID=A0A8J6C9T1_DIALT|nr:hypothetical protein KFE25_004852 [Diacronema lutheri]|mmetsp:Transcript_13411/g.42018  ORF Transcript_13411/g.42018 Transcript_13411/m.42018 type:complete len:132 (-) Transcript_13411:116-511(-)
MSQGFFPGTASLVEDIDKRLLVVLRDGRKIIGTLRSFDQFSNIVLETTVERIIVSGQFADLPLGLYVVRGENIVLLGPVDEEKEANLQQLERVDVDTILAAKRAAEEAERLKAELTKQLRVDWLRDDGLFD